MSDYSVILDFNNSMLYAACIEFICLKWQFKKTEGALLDHMSLKNF